METPVESLETVEILAEPKETITETPIDKQPIDKQPIDAQQIDTPLIYDVKYQEPSKPSKPSKPVPTFYVILFVAVVITMVLLVVFSGNDCDNTPDECVGDMCFSGADDEPFHHDDDETFDPQIYTD